MARLGEVSFPDPNRKTKRFPDESGVAPCPSGALLSLRSVRAAPRAAYVGTYIVTLHWDDGYVGTIGDHVVVKRAFPSVPYYDQEGNRYDLKGKLIPTGKSATPKARKKYVPRRQSVVPPTRFCPSSRRCWSMFAWRWRGPCRRNGKPIGCASRRRSIPMAAIKRRACKRLPNRSRR
jgi:hypothetical protein